MYILINLFIKLFAGILVMWIHEVTKAIVAYQVTHPIYKKKSDFKCDLIKVIDPIGALMFAFMSFGWQKPVEYNVARFRDKEKGLIAVSLSGQIANLVVMAICIPILKNVYLVPYVSEFVQSLIYFNFAIVIVNFLPVPPLETSKLIYAFSAEAYFKLIQNERVIHAIFILLIVFNIIGVFISQAFAPIQLLL